MYQIHNPKVSVIITCYNYGEFLNAAIYSCLSSTFDDIEIIVVNDGSTDPYTLEVFDKLNYKNLRVIHQKNKGLPAARNTGIQSALGKYILPVDADDLINPILIEKEYKILEERPDIGFVTHWTQAFGTEDYIWSVPPFNVKTLLERNIVCVTSLFRKRAWADAGGYNEQMNEGFEDWDFWVSLAQQGWLGYTLEEILFYYRRHGDTMLTGALRKYQYLHNRIRNNHLELYEKYGL
ncbi:glycosyltransferase family 2 protein [Clostridium estertheticum]|uniref:glycosyltransferase family 2 protein n=1 Tax=Clostridium estertheticum TaxID=238834 RepID=UPI0013E96E91|nr:glycosyltransferase family A protein [Clostridium estertheticum]MBZ9686386.1 glycosyltransferase family 2 protein [Clostridium estertheticum]